MADKEVQKRSSRGFQIERFMKVKSDNGSEFSNLSNWKEEA